MRMRSCKFALLAGWVLCMAGCLPGQYHLPELESGPVPSPAEDLPALQAFFKAHEGQLGGAAGEPIEWQDTSLFRMYRFARHTVVVFPYHWDARRFHIIIFAGHLEAGVQNPYEAVQYHSKEGPDYRFWTEGIAWDPLPAGREQAASLFGFYLGEPLTEVATSHTRYLRETMREPVTATEREREIKELTALRDTSWGTRGDTSFEFYYRQGRLVYMSFWTKGGIALGQYAITHPQTPVVRQGRLEVR